MKMTYYLGIDLGTSAIKTILIDDQQIEHASVTVPLSIARPHQGWSEQNPEEWWQGVDQAITEIAQNHPEQCAQLRGIGLSGQMHGLVALDADYTPLRDAILWNDTRASQEATMLDQKHPQFRAIGGNIVMAGFSAPKAVWMARHEAELFAQINTILLPKDYLRFRLTGQMVSDMSDASGTLWLDVENRCWSEELLAATGLRLDQMPRLVESSEKSGHLSASLCQKWGIKGDVVVAGGAGDNAAAAIGLGMTEPEDCFVSLGTSGVVYKVKDGFYKNPDKAVHAFCHALPQSWHQMGVILSAGDSMAWLSDVMGQDVAKLLKQMNDDNRLEIWPLFHPYLSGERTPHNIHEPRGGFFGLSRRHDTGDMVRAVLQGVSYAIGDAFDVLDDQQNPDHHMKPAQVIATGGGAKNRYWLECIASVMNCNIDVPKDSDIGAALGAGRLAMLADGFAIKDVCQKPAIAHRVMPDPALQEALYKGRALSQHLFEATNLH